MDGQDPSQTLMLPGTGDSQVSEGEPGPIRLVTASCNASGPASRGQSTDLHQSIHTHLKVLGIQGARETYGSALSLARLSLGHSTHSGERVGFRDPLGKVQQVQSLSPPQLTSGRETVQKSFTLVPRSYLRERDEPKTLTPSRPDPYVAEEDDKDLPETPTEQMLED